MSARPLMLILASSLVMTPFAFGEHAAHRGGGGGSQPSSGGSSGGGGGSPSVHVESSRSAPSAPSFFATSDRAVHRGGSSSSSGSSGGRSSGGHPTVSSSGSRSGSGSSSSAGASGASSSDRSTAARRHPRASEGRGYDRDRGHRGGRGYNPSYGYGYGAYGYYPGWGWGSYWWPYGSYGWYGDWGYPYGWGGTYRYSDRERGAIRVLVEPSEARVYVDGYYAGTVDDFDGLFQRLYVSPGRHEITVKLEGYQSHRMKVYVQPGSTFKLEFDMEKGAGETVADLAANVPNAREPEPRPERAPSVGRNDAASADDEADDESDAESDQPEADARPRDAAKDADAAPRLRLMVTPPDASVYVDGSFRGTAREAASLRLPVGRHRLEIVRPGYRTVDREVEVAPDGATEIEIELDKSSI